MQAHLPLIFRPSYRPINQPHPGVNPIQKRFMRKKMRRRSSKHSPLVFRPSNTQAPGQLLRNHTEPAPRGRKPPVTVAPERWEGARLLQRVVPSDGTGWNGLVGFSGGTGGNSEEFIDKASQPIPRDQPECPKKYKGYNQVIIGLPWSSLFVLFTSSQCFETTRSRNGTKFPYL